MTYINFHFIDFLAFLPEFFLIIFGLCALIYGVTVSTSSSLGYPLVVKNIHWFSIQALVFCVILVILNPVTSLVFFQRCLYVTPFISFVKVLLIVSGIFTFLLSLSYVRFERVNAFEYVLLIFLSLIGMLLLVSCFDFISFYLALELQSLCLYVLAASKRNSEYCLEAGLKYLILSAFSSGLLLFGITLIYGFTGTLTFDDLYLFFSYIFNTGITDLSQNLVVLELGMLFTFVGLLFKVNAVPFHMWVPDVYEGSPTAVTAFFSTAPKVASMLVLLQFTFFPFSPFFYQSSTFSWFDLFFYTSIFSILLGSFAGLYQTRLKRLLAYSTIANVGYMLIGFLQDKTLFFSVLPPSSTVLFLFIYIFMTVNIFVVILSLRRQKNSLLIKYLIGLASLSKMNPVLALTLALTLLSMAGIPPLAGFIGKVYLFFSAVKSGYILLAVAGILMSAVATFYYIRLVKVMYFEKIDHFDVLIPVSRENSLLLGVTFLFILFFIVSPDLLISFCSYVCGYLL
uniref:NADH dehydrogenase subunit 2 n=1 Tax=Gloeochaete wittrockiana TaxID=38269 RepID=A0A096Y6T5_9EUKA|nr:NADH dehydrogenase subunit 2 [Gloeochaete wittrockiana]AIM52046.1 NADH dehydrogenase subunit 2 [Gloeochaete wittrockiana]